MTEQFRYVVKTPGVAALAGFESESRAQDYIRYVTTEGHYNMRLVVIDQRLAINAENKAIENAEELASALKRLITD